MSSAMEVLRDLGKSFPFRAAPQLYQQGQPWERLAFLTVNQWPEPQGFIRDYLF